MSRESRFVGYLVLGFGVLAIIAVLIIALGGKKEETPVVAGAKPEAQSLIAQSDMEGDWQAAIGKFTAVLQIRKNVYQIILAQPDPNAPRYYSSGTFKVVEDVMVLTPRIDWPPPASPAGKKIGYSILTQAPFPMIAVFKDGGMLWQNPPQSEKRVRAPLTSPIFKSERVDYVSWKKLN